MEYFGFHQILEENVSKQMETPFHNNFSFQNTCPTKQWKMENYFFPIQTLPNVLNLQIVKGKTSHLGH